MLSFYSVASSYVYIKDLKDFFVWSPKSSGLTSFLCAKCLQLYSDNNSGLWTSDKKSYYVHVWKRYTKKEKMVIGLYI